MRLQKTFCEYCMDDKEYTIHDVELESTIKGEKYRYKGRKATCNTCGEEVYVGEINDYNLHALYDEIRRQQGIISLNEIRDIPKKYNIGKRPLSKLLGWGEHTFSRYMEGDIPSKEYSDKLKDIYDNPYSYYELLKSSTLKDEYQAAYEKSLETVKKIINGENDSMLYRCSVYIINSDKDITNLALQKILYYYQGFTAALKGVFVFKEDCEAWVHGPVYREIYNKYSKYGSQYINEKDIEISPNIEGYLDNFDTELLDYIIKYFGCYSGKVLENFTHTEEPWLKARQGLEPNEYSREIITKESIKGFFLEIKDKYSIAGPVDIKEYSLKKFEEYIV